MSGRRLVRALLVRLFPAYGKHRGATAVPAPEPAPGSRHRRRLPRHRSPYARDAAEGRLFVDTPRLVRPYILAPYVSPACHIGTHATCDKGTPEPEITSAPGVHWEVCACPCHEEDPGAFVGVGGQWGAWPLTAAG
ncbi:hypothetical protein [Streptomyces sp. NPDC053427]|uniref:hypothetical protein n=1 Tax=Streptomyces sp. NPDC053427 TaxID=3365701 RepID=UPI0037CD47CA